MKKYFKNIGAYIMFAVFLLNSVPKVYIHHAFSTHKHHVVANDYHHHDGENALTNNNHCECEKYFTDHLFQHFIAQLEFINEKDWIPNPIPVSDIVTIETPFHQLRGPPVFVM